MLGQGMGRPVVFTVVTPRTELLTACALDTLAGILAYAGVARYACYACLGLSTVILARYAYLALRRSR